ncbi:hypothetical protein DV113_005188, partial [Geotrichum candidum]
MVKASSIFSVLAVASIASATNYEIVPTCDRYPQAFNQNNPPANVTATSVDLVNGVWQVTYHVQVKDVKNCGIQCIWELKKTEPGSQDFMYSGNGNGHNTEYNENFFDFYRTYSVPNPTVKGDLLCAPDINFQYDFRSCYNSFDIKTGCSSGNVSPTVCWRTPKPKTSTSTKRSTSTKQSTSTKSTRSTKSDKHSTTSTISSTSSSESASSTSSAESSTSSAESSTSSVESSTSSAESSTSSAESSTSSAASSTSSAESSTSSAESSTSSAESSTSSAESSTSSAESSTSSAASSTSSAESSTSSAAS